MNETADARSVEPRKVPREHLDKPDVREGIAWALARVRDGETRQGDDASRPDERRLGSGS